VSLAARSETLTNKTLDAEGTGNSITIPRYVELTPAVCQNATATLGSNVPTANPPTATCANSDAGDATDTTGVAGYGTASFANNGTAATANVMQFRLQLPTTWTGSLDLRGYWRSATTTNDVVWQVQTMCVDDGETAVQSTANDFNAANSSGGDAAKGTANQWNEFSISGLTTTGCTAGDVLFLRLFRDATNAGDTHAAAAELVSLQLKLRTAE
jgi:hypothetical protein